MSDKSRGSAVQKRIRRRNRLMAFLAVVVFAIVCLFTPIFNITGITVTGNKVLKEEDIVSASGIKRGDNLFLINTNKGEKAINALGYVETVQIKRKFFSRIEIEVTESIEAAYIAFSGSYVGISDAGKVLSITKSGKKTPKKAVISGYALKSAKKGEYIDGKSERKTETVKLMLSVLSRNGILPSVKKIDVSSLNEVYFTLDSDTRIIMGSTDQADYKLKCLSAVLDELGEIRGGKINLSNPANVIYEGGN